MKLLKEFFLLLFLSCQFSHFFVCFFAKEESSQFLFFHFFVKKKERKKTMDLFFTFLLMIPSCKLCFDDFFSLFVRLFVCWFVVTPGKQITTTKEKLKREREKTETETKKLRHVSNDTVQCSSVLVLEVVFDGLGQV